MADCILAEHPRVKLATQATGDIPLLTYQILDNLQKLEDTSQENVAMFALLRALATRVCTLGQASWECLVEDESARPLADLAKEVTYGC